MNSVLEVESYQQYISSAIQRIERSKVSTPHPQQNKKENKQIIISKYPRR
ncbi:hypothetical protein LguiA_022661 [Lonicera macranthoides]